MTQPVSKTCNCTSAPDVVRQPTSAPADACFTTHAAASALRDEELLTNACSDSYSESLGQLAEILDLFRSEKESLNEAEGLLRLTIDVLEKKSGEKLDVAL